MTAVEGLKTGSHRGQGGLPKGGGDFEEGLGSRGGRPSLCHFSLVFPSTLAPKISATLRCFICSLAHSFIHTHSLYSLIYIQVLIYSKQNKISPCPYGT